MGALEPVEVWRSNQSEEFGDRLIDLGLAESPCLLGTFGVLDLDTSEALSCVSRWQSGRFRRREALLDRCLEKITQNHLYASRLADIKLNAGEWESSKRP